LRDAGVDRAHGADDRAPAPTRGTGGGQSQERACDQGARRPRGRRRAS
jgi:hypothetical protein